MYQELLVNPGHFIIGLMPQSHLLQLWIWHLADESIPKNLLGARGTRWWRAGVPANFYMLRGHLGLTESL